MPIVIGNINRECVVPNVLINTNNYTRGIGG